MPIPDEKIFPHATGLAEKTVSAHQEPNELVFHAGWFCPFVQRAWITLEERGIPYQYKEVNPYKKEKHFLDINPKGLVPAVEFHNKALYESLVICEFLEDAYPSYPSLYPSDPYDRGYARIWIDFAAKQVAPTQMRLIMAQTPEKQDEERKEYIKALKTFSEQIKGPYFLGDKFSLVDVVIAPWVVRDYIVSENRGFKREDVGEKWVQYAQQLQKRDSIVKTSSEKEHYAELYGRYLRDEAQSEGAKAWRAGKSFS